MIQKSYKTAELEFWCEGVAGLTDARVEGTWSVLIIVRTLNSYMRHPVLACTLIALNGCVSHLQKNTNQNSKFGSIM